MKFSAKIRIFKRVKKVKLFLLIIGRFCGNGRIDEIIMSMGSRMLITHVISEKGSTTMRGFSAIFESEFPLN